ITLHDIDQKRAGKLAELVSKAFPACIISTGAADPRGMDIAVNATPLGMHASDPLPMDVSGFTPDMLVVDIIMEPVETALLQAARKASCRIQHGRPMMQFQIQAMADFFDVDRKDRANG
ncbi:shikimate dehydrogenase, partial [Alcaligenaceae bacterium Me47]